MSGNFEVAGDFCPDELFLYPPLFDPTNKSALTLWVPFVEGSAVVPGQSGCTIAQSGANTVFALTGWVSKNDQRTYAQITVAPDLLFSCKPADRQSLLAAFLTFREAFDGLEGTQCLLPQAGRVLAQRVAQALPLSFDETLLFTYRLDPAVRCVDLSPGMRVRVDRGTYQYVAPPSFSGGSRNAYAGSGSISFDLRVRADGSLGFNALIDRFQGISLDTSPVQIAGLLDLEAAGSTLRYGRLIYPPQLQAVTTIDKAPDISQNAALIFAGNYADLETATANYQQSGSTGGVGNAYFFSGRDAVWCEIPIYVNGERSYVPIGTTLRDLLATTFVVSSLDIPNSTLAVQLSRWVQPSLIDPNTGAQVLYAAVSVDFGSTPVLTTAGTTQWDLPLEAGDVITWTIPT